MSPELTEAEQRSSQPASTSTSYSQVLPERKQLRDSQGRLMLKNLTLQELEQWCVSVGEHQDPFWDDPCPTASGSAWSMQAVHCSCAQAHCVAVRLYGSSITLGKS
jgi:hypothetical protein